MGHILLLCDKCPHLVYCVLDSGLLALARRCALPRKVFNLKEVVSTHAAWLQGEVFVPRGLRVSSLYCGRAGWGDAVHRVAVRPTLKGGLALSM